MVHGQIPAVFCTTYLVFVIPKVSQIVLINSSVTVELCSFCTFSNVISAVINHHQLRRHYLLRVLKICLCMGYTVSALILFFFKSFGALSLISVAWTIWSKQWKTADEEAFKLPLEGDEGFCTRLLASLKNPLLLLVLFRSVSTHFWAILSLYLFLLFNIAHLTSGITAFITYYINWW